MVYFFGAVLKSQIKEKFIFFLNDTYKLAFAYLIFE